MARGENGPVGLEMIVGWVLSGVVGERKNETYTIFISHTHVLKIANERSLKNLDENVKKFGDLESIAIKRKIYISRIIRLPDNFEQCEKRFESKFSHLKNDPELLSKYHETFKEQQKLGIIEQVETLGKI